MKLLLKICFVFVFQFIYKEKMFTIEIEDGRVKALCIILQESVLHFGVLKGTNCSTLTSNIVDCTAICLQ